MTPFLSTDLLCCGKVMEEELEVFCVQLLTFSVEMGNINSLGKHSLERSEITQGAFPGSLFLVRSICLRWAMEQKMENDYTRENKKEVNGHGDWSPKEFCLNPWQKTTEVHL